MTAATCPSRPQAAAAVEQRAEDSLGSSRRRALRPGSASRTGERAPRGTNMAQAQRRFLRQLRRSSARLLQQRAPPRRQRREVAGAVAHCRISKKPLLLRGGRRMRMRFSLSRCLQGRELPEYKKGIRAEMAGGRCRTAGGTATATL